MDRRTEFVGPRLLAAQRQVDLDHVETELAQQPKAGVARADVVGRDPHAGVLDRDERGPEPVGVPDRLALGQLEDDPPGAMPFRRRIDRNVAGLNSGPPAFGARR